MPIDFQLPQVPFQVRGLLVLLGITLVCNWMELHVISWLLQKTVTLIFVALPIVFQPELRRALEHLGQGRFLGNAALLDDEQARSVVHELVRAVRTLASTNSTTSVRRASRLTASSRRSFCSMSSSRTRRSTTVRPSSAATA